MAIITRYDRGLDFKRIEKIASMMSNVANDSIRALNNRKDEYIKNRKEVAFKELGLLNHIEAIDNIDKKIKELEKEKSIHVEKIKEFTKTKNQYYNDYAHVEKDSKVYEFINKESDDFDNISNSIKELKSKIENKLWLAKDIDEAIVLYDSFLQYLEGIVANGK